MISSLQKQSYSQSRFLSSMVNLLRASSREEQQSPAPDLCRARPDILASLPEHFKPHSPALDPNALDFLYSSGALMLPSPAVQGSLIRAYARGVHANMPCVDIHHVAGALGPVSATRASISLMLYQAVMFAGSIFVSPNELECMGYETRRVAMDDLFRRVKVSPLPSNWEMKS